MTTELCKFCGLEAGKHKEATDQQRKSDLEICPLCGNIQSILMAVDRYPEGSEWNKAWRYCHKCGHRSLIDDRDHPLDVPRLCPQCKTVMSDHKPMVEVLETKDATLGESGC